MSAGAEESVAPTFASEADGEDDEPEDNPEELGGNSQVEEGGADDVERNLDSEDAQPDKRDVNVEEADVDDSDFGGLVTGTETASSSDEEESDDSGTSTTSTSSDGDDGDDLDPEEMFDASNEALEEAINGGLGRLAVQGLDADAEDYDRDAMEDDFTEIAEAFRVGYFGAEFADEYFFTEGEKVDPTWGLLGSLVVFSAFVLMQRPDGDEQVAKMKEAVANIGGGE